MNNRTCTPEPEALTALQMGFVPVCAGNQQRPLFLIQDKDSIDMAFALVDDRLNKNLPIYCLSMETVGTPRPTTVEGLAVRMVDTIRGVQPTGPYRLAGLLQGGLVAYEIATQLVGRDQAVEFVGLVGDTVRCSNYVPQPAPSIPVHIFPGPEEFASVEYESQVAWQSLLPMVQIRVVVVPYEGRGSCAPSWRTLGAAMTMALTESVGRVQETPEARYRAQITIQTGQRSQQPLFCIPGAGDSVTGFTDLATALGSTWPVQGLQPSGIDGLLVPHSTVEAAASSYMRAIDAIQPRGPVHLLGHSFGGWVAFEIACRLSAIDRPVASLTLIDSEVPNQKGIVGREHTSLDVYAHFIESLELAAEKPLGIERAELELASEPQRLRLVHAGMVRVGLMQARSRPEILAGCLRTFGAALRTVYLPQQEYHGETRLILVSDIRLDGPANTERFQQTLSGWQRLARNVSHLKGPGNHMTILKPPHVQVLTKWWLDAGRLQVHESPQHVEICDLPVLQ